MCKPRQPITTLVTLAVALIPFLGCKSTETSSTTPPAVAEKPSTPASEAPACQDCIPVTVENFPRAESDLFFGNIAKQDGFGKFNHNRTPAPVDDQKVIRLNRDTLYSAAVFDLDAGPVTITLPDAGKRFLSMQVINEDEYTPMVVYGKGSYTLSKDKVGTRYVIVGIRTLVNPDDPHDLDEVHALQDAIKVSQKSPGQFETPKWDPASQKKVREALLVLGSTLPDMKGAFGIKAQVNPVRYLIGSASAWGGNPSPIPAQAKF
jgi:hypothetical protein